MKEKRLVELALEGNTAAIKHCGKHLNEFLSFDKECSKMKELLEEREQLMKRLKNLTE